MARWKLSLFMSEKSSINQTIDHLFRHEYGKLTSFLTARFGRTHIDLIEDAVQDALYKAMQLWPYKQVPNDPGKWLYRTAHNSIIDRLRRDKKSIPFEASHFEESAAETIADLEQIPDEQLKMIFACCHPDMKEMEQLMLSLKLLCGFSNKEISRSLFKSPEAVKKALTRAKQKFKNEVGELSIPNGAALNERLAGVLRVIYLLFNNGYTAYDGDQLLKKDVCEDAIRLSAMLYQNQQCRTPELCALMALMCFNFSRFDSRIDEAGNMLVMEAQNRDRWDTDLIQLGLRFIRESAVEKNLTNYHIEATIACEYAISNNFDSINWAFILTMYDQLMLQSPNPVVALNRLVIYEKLQGTKKAMEALKNLDDKALQENYLYFSIKGDFEKKLGLKGYKISLERAITLTANEKEKAFLERKMKDQEN